MLLDILVPKTGSALGHAVESRSAIVSGRGDLAIPGIRVVYYEGNAFGAANLVEFHERLISAGGRLEHRYPTSALLGVDPDDVEIVGVFDTASAAVVEVIDQDALIRWAGEPIESICGQRLDEGVVDYAGAVSVLQNGKQIGRPRDGVISYRSRAGQVIELDIVRKSARVSPSPVEVAQAVPFRP